MTRIRVAAALLPLLPLLPLLAFFRQSPTYGRWDLTVHDSATTWPMWLELVPGPKPTGRLQKRGGHALPLAGLVVEGPKVTFPLPFETPRADPPTFAGVVTGDDLLAELIELNGRRTTVRGKRAPSLARAAVPEWGEPMDLMAEGLDGWTLRGERNGWTFVQGELSNAPPSSDLFTRRQFTDFSLHLEVNVPNAGNSGIYLRGRYEVQVQDDFGRPPYSRGMGGIYGQVTPVALPARPAGEWQTFDITLVGRRVTVVLNGVTILEDAEIPGITGGALDSDEGAPGPLMLQGDHSAVRYRNLTVRVPR